jgi:membrane fusion protein (multidrug efflux system)
MLLLDCQAIFVNKIVIKVLLLTMIFLVGCGEEPKKVMPPPTVEVAKVQQRDVSVNSEWIGSIDGYVNATIRAQVQGYLTKLLYHEGDFVKKGQPLFQIDPRPFKALLDKAKSQAAMNEARWRQTKANLERVKPLAAEDALSKKDLDDSIASEETARASYQGAEAELEKAQLNFEYTTITAPIDGIAGIAKAQIGNLVGPSQTEELTTVSQVDPIKVYFSISEQEYLKAVASQGARRQEDSKLELILADGTLYAHKGKFLIADRQVDVKTGTIKIAASFPNPRKILRPGQYGRVRAVGKTIKGALLIPQRAVMELQGKYLVAVVGADAKIDFRTVKTAERIDGNLWIIVEGLKPDETIVVEGIQKIRPGMKVTTMPFVAPATDAAAPETKTKPEQQKTHKAGKE